MKRIIFVLLSLMSLASFADEQMMNMPGMRSMPQGHSDHQVTQPKTPPENVAKPSSAQVQVVSPARSPELTPDPDAAVQTQKISRPSVILEGIGQTPQKCDEPCLGCITKDKCQNTRASDTNRDTNEANPRSRNADQPGTRVNQQ